MATNEEERMRPVVTRKVEGSGTGAVLYMALELSDTRWVVAFTVGLGQKPRRRAVEAGDLVGLAREVEAAKRRFELPADARVVSCYEAGLDGFWLHRALDAHGIENRVVNSAAIEVPRGRKRPKTDRLDAGKLAEMLVRYEAGEKKVWSVVRVPSMEAEDLRHNDRELERLKEEQTAAVNGIKMLLKTQGIRLRGRLEALPERLEALRRWDGTGMGEELKARLRRIWARLGLVQEQLEAVEARRQKLLGGPSRAAQAAQQLMCLKALGPTLSWRLCVEVFGWRTFRNRRELAGLLGLAPVPFQSGGTAHDSGHAKTGRSRLRASITELAWGWVRYQPASALTRWYREHFEGSKRLRRIGIIALARKLMIELWKYLETGALPEGALTKA